MLSAEDKIILEYLKPLGKAYATAKEVCRRAGGKSKFNDDPEWAKKFLKRLEKQGILETNPLGHYRIKRDENNTFKIPLDPSIRKILASSGQDFSESFLLEDPDDYTKPGGGKKS